MIGREFIIEVKFQQSVQIALCFESNHSDFNGTTRQIGCYLTGAKVNQLSTFRSKLALHLCL